MTTPTVSIIIPSYNSAQYVADAIESALNQTIESKQVIVVNDGSTDDTAELLNQYRDRIEVIHQENRGLSGARNTGLRSAKGECVAFLDADDAWHPRKLELQIKALSAVPHLGMVGSDTFDYPTQPFPHVGDDLPIHEVPLKKLLVRNYFTASAVLVRRVIAQQVGEFDTTLPNAEDLDYWQRTAELCGVANIKLPLTGYRQVPGSLSRRPRAMEIGLERVLLKLDARNAWRGQTALRRKFISYYHYACAHLYGAAGHRAFAVRRMLQSLAWYPLPYERSESGARFARPRRLAVLSLRMLRLMPPEHALAAGGRS
jgi:glycosyltransferase involved in cell wall biosynthesis